MIFQKKRFDDIDRELGQITQMIGANDPRRDVSILAACGVNILDNAIIALGGAIHLYLHPSAILRFYDAIPAKKT